MTHDLQIGGGPDEAISGRQALLLLSKVAETITSPLQFVHHDHIATICGPLQQDQLTGLCKSAAISTRLNQTIAETIGTKALKITPQTVTGLRHSKTINNIFALITAPYAQIEAFLRQATAVRLQNAIRNCVLKADRERVRSTLGDDAYNTATREAPLFYANIMADVDHRQFAMDTNDATSVLKTGATLFRSYIQEIDAGLAQLFTWRLPGHLITGAVPLDGAQMKSCNRLLAAKGPGMA